MVKVSACDANAMRSSGANHSVGACWGVRVRPGLRLQLRLCQLCEGYVLGDVDSRGHTPLAALGWSCEGSVRRVTDVEITDSADGTAWGTSIASAATLHSLAATATTAGTRPNHFQIRAGGHYWHDGRVSCMCARPEHGPVPTAQQWPQQSMWNWVHTSRTCSGSFLNGLGAATEAFQAIERRPTLCFVKMCGRLLQSR